ncbi:hypothetical protein CC79DRAFT_1357557 [Sarocladium strictum]
MAAVMNAYSSESWKEVQFINQARLEAMDTIGVAFQTVQILAATIKAVRDAIGRQKDQAEVLKRVKSEVQETKCIVQLIEDQEELHGSGALCTILQRIHIIGHSLMEHIQSMDKERSAIRAFTHQITSGSSERQDLTAILRLLGRAKQDLTLHIQLVQVGLTMNAQKAITVNIELVEEINRMVQRTLGEERGLIIASFVNEMLEGGGKIQDDGSLQLTSAQYKRFLLEGTQLGHPGGSGRRNEAQKGNTRRKERIVLDNLSVNSTQINVPITAGKEGDDVWAEMDSVTIRGNVALGQSFQANYPMTLEVLREARRV